MSDDPFYRPNRPAPARREPAPGELLWTFRRDDVTWSAELRFHGESWGWEAQILRDGVLVMGRRLGPRQLAVQWADEERKAMEKRGRLLP